jgi:hypothetical protein
MHPIPQRCAHRPLAGGLVVPYVSLIPGGHAAFGTLDADRARTAFLPHLCQVCRHPLDERCFLIVRPADIARGHSPEPALHPECLPCTAATCPMLNGQATHYRQNSVLASHPAGRPCTDPSCPCPSRPRARTPVVPGPVPATATATGTAAGVIGGGARPLPGFPSGIICGLLPGTNIPSTIRSRNGQLTY